MSVELRFIDEGHFAVCDWGRIEHSDPRPCQGEVGPLMLIAREYAQKLLWEPPRTRADGCCTDHVTSTPSPGGNRLFAHVEHGGTRWTWELFEAHWQDGWNECPLYVGRWPD